MTSTTAPRAAVPMTGLPVLGDWWTFADGVLTLNTVPCAWSGDALMQSATMMDGV